MLSQFSGTQLLFGQESMERLYHARVAVFGIGGVGGYTVEALARSGIGALGLIGDDRACLTNLNCQLRHPQAERRLCHAQRRRFHRCSAGGLHSPEDSISVIE